MGVTLSNLAESDRIVTEADYVHPLPCGHFIAYLRWRGPDGERVYCPICTRVMLVRPETETTMTLTEQIAHVLCPSYDCDATYAVNVTEAVPCAGHSAQAEAATKAVVTWLRDAGHGRVLNADTLAGRIERGEA